MSMDFFGSPFSVLGVKKIMRKTGEVVEVIASDIKDNGARSDGDWVSYIDSNGVEHIKEHLNLQFDFKDEDTWQARMDKLLEEAKGIDRWEQRRYELAKDYVLCKGKTVGYAVSAADEIISALKKSPGSRYYTRKECCEILRCSMPTFHSLVNKGLIPVTKVGRKTLVPADEFDRIVASGELHKFKHHPKKGL